MKKIILLVVGIILINIVAATDYQAHPLNCPNSYQAQTCSGSDLVCGYSGGVTFCYDMTTLNPPASDDTSNSGDTYQSSLQAGFIINCHAYDGTEPHCDNSGGLWCNRNITCYNIGRQSTCKANTWSNQTSQTECAGCRTGYVYCDGSYTDADGCEIQSGVTQFNQTSEVLEDNVHHKSDCLPECDSGYLDCDEDIGEGGTGCEILDGGVCTAGALTGTYNGCSEGAGNCVVSKTNFTTGTFIEYLVNLGNGAMLWFKNYGTAPLINATSDVSGNKSFIVDKDLNVNTAGNLTLGDRIIFRLGEAIHNIIDGMIAVEGILNVSKGITTTNLTVTDSLIGNGTDYFILDDLNKSSSSFDNTNIAYVNNTNVFQKNQNFTNITVNGGNIDIWHN